MKLKPEPGSGALPYPTALFPLSAAEHAGREEGTGGEDHRTGGQPATFGKLDA